MTNLGAHVSTSGGLHTAFERAQLATCNVVQIFSKNQKQWAAKALLDADIARFKDAHRDFGACPLIVHDSYLINLASPDDTLWEKSIAAFTVELARCQQLGIPFLVTHPGAHVGSGETAGLERVGAALRRILADGAGGDTTILLETTAGQGTALGHSFAHLGRLIELSDASERVGVCLDTCHVLAAGYDFRTPTGYAAMFAEFDQQIGLDRLQAFHLNDSKTEVGSRVDRHTHIGEGFIGLAGFGLLVNDARFANHPMVLETPKEPDESADIQNLATLRGLRHAAASVAA